MAGVLDVPGMHTVTDATELAQGLSNGGFCVLRWELGDRDEQKRSLEALCHERGTDIIFIDLAPKNVTVVANIKAVPSEARVRLLIAGIDEARWQARKST